MFCMNYYCYCITILLTVVVLFEFLIVLFKVLRLLLFLNYEHYKTNYSTQEFVDKMVSVSLTTERDVFNILICLSVLAFSYFDISIFKLLFFIVLL